MILLNKLGIEKCNLLKAICDKPTANIIPSGDRLKAFPRRLDAHPHYHPIQYWTGNPGQSNCTGKERKGIQLGRKK